MKDPNIKLPNVPFIFQYGQYNEDDLRQPDCRLIPYRDFQEIMQDYARSAIEPYAKRIAELEAARIAYASEFAPDEDGNPDVGRIHENIRKLKADLQRGGVSNECEPVGEVAGQYMGAYSVGNIFYPKDGPLAAGTKLYTCPKLFEPDRGEPVRGERFIRAWINLEELPGGMMVGPEGRFGPVPASTSCWITTSEKEAARLKADGPVLEIWATPQPLSESDIFVEMVGDLSAEASVPSDEEIMTEVYAACPEFDEAHEGIDESQVISAFRALLARYR